MDLEDLRAFVAVADTGSFLGAADLLDLPRTTIRRRVAALEARAGVPLLDGTPRGVVLTEAGTTLVEQGRRMMQEMRALLAAVRDLGETPRGTLRVVIPAGLPPDAVVRLLGVLRSAYPALRFHLRTSNAPAQEPLDDVDVAVHLDDDAPGPAWVSFPIVRLRRHLLAHESYLASRGTPATLDALATHDVLAWQAPGEDATTLRTRAGRRLRVSPVFVSTDLHLVHLACAAGQGIAFVPDGMRPDVTGAEPLVAILEDQLSSELTLRMSVPRALAEVPKIRVLVEHARALANSG